MIIYHQQNSLPQNADRSVERAGGVITARIPQIGVAVAESSNPGFAAAMADDPWVAGVAEDVELQMIPGRDKLHAEVLNAPDAAGDGPVEPTGDDTHTGPDPFYNPFQ